MPTVLRQGGFQVVIYPPPREHGPPHVHVFFGSGHIKIDLPTPGQRPAVRTAHGMRATDAWRAVRLVAEHAEMLYDHWRTIHDARR